MYISINWEQQFTFLAGKVVKLIVSPIHVFAISPHASLLNKGSLGVTTLSATTGQTDGQRALHYCFLSEFI